MSRADIEISRLSPAICVDTEYLALLQRRLPWNTLEDMGLGDCVRIQRR
jgi:hypothetical protein